MLYENSTAYKAVVKCWLKWAFCSNRNQPYVISPLWLGRKNGDGFVGETWSNDRFDKESGLAQDLGCLKVDGFVESEDPTKGALWVSLKCFAASKGELVT